MAAIHGVVVGGAPALAYEFVINGSFSTATDWSQVGAEWVISGGVATYTAGIGTSLSQAFPPGSSLGLVRVTYKVDSVSGGSVYFTVTHTGGSITGTSRSAPGTYTQDIDIALFDISQIRFSCTGTSCAIDNVSLRPFL